MALNGTLIRLKVMHGSPSATEKLINEETKTDITFTKDTFETTSKDSGAWRERISSYKSAEISCEAFVEYNPPTGKLSFEDLYAIYNETTSREYIFGSSIAGAVDLTGKFLLTNLKKEAANETGATMSFTLVSDGAIASEAVS